MRKSHPQRREEIIQGTLELAARIGPQRITTQAIADQVGIAQATLFRHFRSRDDILAATIRWLAGTLLARLERISREQRKPGQRLRAILQAQLAFVQRHRGVPRMLFSDRLHVESPLLKRAVQETMGCYLTLLTRVIREGMEAGEIGSTMPPESGARYVMATLQGLMMRWSILDFGFSLEGEAAPLWQFVSRALVLEPSQPPQETPS